MIVLFAALAPGNTRDSNSKSRLVHPTDTRMPRGEGKDLPFAVAVREKRLHVVLEQSHVGVLPRQPMHPVAGEVLNASERNEAGHGVLHTYQNKDVRSYVKMETTANPKMVQQARDSRWKAGKRRMRAVSAAFVVHYIQRGIS